ncbi:condensation domain-containing protein [Rudaeicoccus suwonensis]|uniref:condensation domain-containing protein n=1 Tax=Rudaeicoccus suwonensis TaxID=657409 RepID=UPI001477093B|nr:condensation domain-containing protein [Rudaeicoccus suwonensis]
MPDADNLNQDSTSSSASSVLLAALTLLLDGTDVSAIDNFYEIGGDSLVAVELLGRLQSEGWHVAVRDVFDAPSLADTIAKMRRIEQIDFAENKIPAFSRFPLSPPQRDAFESVTFNPDRFNLAAIVHVPEEANPELIENAISAVLETHEMLRVRFDKDETGVNQQVVPTAALMDAVAVEAVGHDDRDGIHKVADRAHSRIALDQGHVCSFTTLTNDAGAWGVMVIANHMVTDAIGWKVLMEDLTSTIDAAARGENFSPVKTSSFRSWVEYLHGLALSADARRAVDGLIDVLSIDPQHEQNPLRQHLDSVRRADTTRVQRLYEVAQAESFQKLCAQHGADVLALSCLHYALRGLAVGGSVPVSMFTSGRHLGPSSLEFSRTVGWFADKYPVILDLGSSSSPEGLLQESAAAVSAALGLQLTYGAVRYLHPDAELRDFVAQVTSAKVALNYRGTVATSETIPYTDHDLGDMHDELEFFGYNISLACDLEPTGFAVSWRFPSQLERLVVPAVDSFGIGLAAIVAAASD